MENTEVLQKLENIEILLQASIENMNKITAEANNPEKRQKEAQILNEASQKHNLLLSEINGLISQEKALIANFRPSVEIKQYSINMKNPLNWVVSCIIFCVLSLGTALLIYEFYTTEKEQKEVYKKESEQKDDNYMKYKWLELFAPRETMNSLKAFDIDYSKNWKTYDKDVIKREKEIDEAKASREQAEQMTAAAKRLKQHADSLQNAK